ncbi:MAG TPA: ABC transporter ATP-binding protein [Actinotalea caeni]|uniref:ABC transporter ATP-binding protein n=1 Tax=Actinotalea caeni TaxID=1348467 RepID=UPI0012E1A2DF|nr:ABC transporter ATP-binding protein [Actinotalea caeni]HLV55692.1 ABC transporter ATP-binding protein [Actinotalea caeni]
MNAPVITTTGVRRTYRGSGAPYEAVRGVDLSIGQGELFALLGTNGAGKTSLLEVVEGLAPASAGEVRVFGKDPYADRAAVRARTGIMLQEAGFPADVRAGEMVRMWAATLSRRSDEDVLAAVGLEHRAGVAVSSLSGGERRRLDLALALLGRPDVLFLDEPTTGLDPESRRDAWSIVRSRLAEGVTVVLTTHYLEEAEELSDRLAIMHEGRVVREGTVADIVAGEPARITFTLPADAPAPPPLLGSAERERGVAGTRYVVTTPQLQEDLFALLAWARDAGVVLGDLDARAASLEQAFLSIAADGAAALDPAA